MTTINQLDRKAQESDPLMQLEKRCIWFYKINGKDLDPNTRKALKEQEEKYFALGHNLDAEINERIKALRKTYLESVVAVFEEAGYSDNEPKRDG